MTECVYLFDITFAVCPINCPVSEDKCVGHIQGLSEDSD